MIQRLCRMIPPRMWDRMAKVPALRWLQDRFCIICGRPTWRRQAHWPCERSLL